MGGNGQPGVIDANNNIIKPYLENKKLKYLEAYETSQKSTLRYVICPEQCREYSYESIRSQYLIEVAEAMQLIENGQILNNGKPVSSMMEQKLKSDARDYLELVMYYNIDETNRSILVSQYLKM